MKIFNIWFSCIPSYIVFVFYILSFIYRQGHLLWLVWEKFNNQLVILITNFNFEKWKFQWNVFWNFPNFHLKLIKYKLSKLYGGKGVSLKWHQEAEGFSEEYKNWNYSHCHRYNVINNFTLEKINMKLTEVKVHFKSFLNLWDQLIIIIIIITSWWHYP